MPNDVSRNPTPMGEFQGFLREATPALVAVLARGGDVERLKRIALTSAMLNPELVTCDRKSYMTALLRCAQDGLLPDGREAVILPFRDKKSGRTQAQYLPMIAGVLKRLRNSGELATITAHCVYGSDNFAYHMGDDERIEHTRAVTVARGAFIAAYAIATLRDGSIYREVMTAEEIDQARQVSRAADGPAWSKWFSEMARKTVLRRLAKRLPSSADLDRMLDMEPDAHRALSQRPVDAYLGKQLPDDPSGQERQHQLACAARAAISDAANLEALGAAWQGIRTEYQHSGIPLPLDVEAAWRDRQEHLAGDGGQL